MSATAQALRPDPTPTETPFDTIKTKQQKAWTSGDYAVVGTTLQIVGESLCEAADICAGEKVLDVAAGNGNATLAAARRFADVVSTDYVPELLEKGRRRAEAEALEVEFVPADAEALQFDDNRFDATLSTFGVMFTPNQDQAAAELLRVTRSGGRIGLANWTPESFVGQIFKAVGKYLPPPAGVKPPALWGTEARISELFASEAEDITITRKQFKFRYASPEHFLAVFRTFYGPVHKAFEALDEQNQHALYDDLMELLTNLNRCRRGTLLVPSDYLEIVVTKL
jgi:ubiquinone/menaquinone biosynthesis C-methylase UbiE